MKIKLAIIEIISVLLINTITPSFATGVITELTPLSSTYSTPKDIQNKYVAGNKEYLGIFIIVRTLITKFNPSLRERGYLSS